MEDSSARTEFTRTWVNPDGSMTTRAFAGQTSVRDAKGAWGDVDLTMAVGSDGSVSPKRPVVGVRVGADGVSAGHGQGRQVVMGWTGKAYASVKPVVKGSSATWADVTPGVDYRVDALRSGFEQFFVVKDAAAVNALTPSPDGTGLSWTVPLKTTGLTAKPQPDGSVDFVDAKGKVVSHFAVPAAWDAARDPRSGEPSSRGAVALSVAQQNPGQASLTISLDRAWATSTDRVFPIMVDPTYASLAQIKPSLDTFVQQGYATSQASATELKLGTYDGSTVARSFLSFPMASMKGLQVKSATLGLYETWSYSCSPRAWQVWDTSGVTSATVWTNQPAWNRQWASTTATKGASSSCAPGWVTQDVTSLAAVWAGNGNNDNTLGIRAASETDAYGWKRFASAETSTPPYLSITYNRKPNAGSAPSLPGASSFTPSGASGALLYTSDLTPALSSAATDPDANTVAMTIQVWPTKTPAAGATPAAECVVSAASGAAGTCSPTTTLADNTEYYARTAVKDDQGLWNGTWSAWTTFRTAATVPATPGVTCTQGFTASGQWQDAAPAASPVCTITGPGAGYSAPSTIHYRLDSGAEKVVVIPQSGDPNVAKTTVTIPNAQGGHSVEAWAVSPTSLASPHRSFTLGWGNSSIVSPAATGGVQVAATTTGQIAITAAAPPRGAAAAPTAQVQWRVSGYDTTETGKWNDATGVTAATMTGADSTTTPIGYQASWDTMTADVDKAATTPVTLNDRVPVLLDIQVCFTYSTTLKQCTWSATRTTVHRVPHAFGNGFPTTSAGPGQVALFTGEYAQDATDVTVPGYTGDLSLSRSHSTYGNAPTTPVTGAAGVFGPGWTANLDGSDAGLAGMTPIDSTLVDGSMVFQDSDGTALVYRPADGTRRTTASMATSWVPADDDTALEATKLTWTEATKSFTLTQDDGTTTVFTATTAPTATTAGVFAPASVTEPGTGATTYTRNAQGLVTRILAPVPTGMTGADCPDNGSTAGLKPGCRALRITYGTRGAPATQVSQVTAELYTPDALTVKACDGSTATAAAGSMASVPVACYTYNTSKQLTGVTDPRSGLGTSYEYGTNNALTKVTPAGQAPFQLAYTTLDSRLKLTAVTRDNPTGGTTALTRVRYDITRTADTNGLPDMSPARTARWTQTTPVAYAAAVFGPDFTGDVTTASGDAWQYADVYGTDAAGYTTNTASWGAGAWQLTYTKYDDRGNTVLALDADAINRIEATPGDSGIAPEVYGTQTVYNPDTTTTTIAGVPAKATAGSYVTDTYGPQRTATLRDGTTTIVRPHTKTLFDQGAPGGGINPKTGIGYGLPTTTTTTAATSRSAATAPDDLEVQSRTFTGYDPKAGADPATSGWTLGTATSTTQDVNYSGTIDAGDITTRTFHNAEGRTVETRQPSEADTTPGAGTTLTSYYTVAAQTGADAACGGKPAWAGLVCRTSKAAQPAGATLPDEQTTKYTYLLTPATAVETSGAVTRTTTTSYLLDGRTDTTRTTVTGLPGSTPRPATKTLYDTATGAAVGTVELDDAGNPTTVKQTSALDSWGRVTTATNQLGDTSTTRYDAAGRVASVTDTTAGGTTMGTVTYGYDGTDLAGRTERRGLTTKLTISRGGAAGNLTYTAAYDADAKMYRQGMPAGLTQDVTFDEAGEPVGLAYSGQVTPYTTSTDANGDPVYTPGTPTTGTWMAWTQANDASGRVVRDYTGQGAAFDGTAGTQDTPTQVAKPGDATGFDRAYGYDGAGRLTRVTDRTAVATGTTVHPSDDPTTAVPCQIRTYGYTGTPGLNGNRTSNTIEDHADGSCTSTPTASTTKTYAYDTADRATTGANGTGTYTYDPLGRVTTLPASDAPDTNNGDLTLGYFDDDLPASVKQGTTDTRFTLDVQGRRLTQTTTGAGWTGATSKIARHYTDSSDNPAWVDTTDAATGSTSTTRFVESIAGDLGAQLAPDGAATLTLANLHGDIVTTITVPATQGEDTPAAAITGWSDYTEFGTPRNPWATITLGGPTGYGWLGIKQRSTTLETAGLTLMGMRLYNPRRGEFTSTDPVVGGNSNSYNYPEDPINWDDVSGCTRCRGSRNTGWSFQYASRRVSTGSQWYKVVHRDRRVQILGVGISYGWPYDILAFGRYSKAQTFYYRRCSNGYVRMRAETRVENWVQIHWQMDHLIFKVDWWTRNVEGGYTVVNEWWE